MIHRIPLAVLRGRTRSLLCAVLLPNLALLVGGCGRSFTRADLVFANGAEPETLDPTILTGQLDGRLAYALFEGLTSFDPAGEPQPGMAERWDLSPDGTTYTFHLREGLRWSDGTHFVAQDFVDSWKRGLEPATAAEYAYQLYYVKNAKRYNDPEAHFTDFSQVGVHAPDDHTLEVVLENATPFFLDVTCTPPLMPVPVKVVERWGDAWVKPEHIVGNGAFVLESWRLNDKIRLRKNPRYWNHDAVHLNTVDALPISQANVALNFFASGVVDLILDKGLTPVSLIGEIRKKPYFHTAPFLGNFFIRYNCTRKPFDDPRVRQALSLVVNKSLIVDKITKAGEIPAHSIVPPGTAGYQPPAGLGYDPARARALLAEAGFPGGRGFPPFSFLYNEGEANKFIGIELKSMFERELGISMSLRPQENKVYLNTMSNLDYELARSSWVGDYNDPNTFMDMWITGSGNNRTGWSNPEYDRLIAEAARTFDKDKRFDIFRRAETMLIRDATAICPLYYYVGVTLYDDKKIGGIQANVLDEHALKAIYLKR